MYDNDLVIGHGNDKNIKSFQDKISELDGTDYDQPSRNRKIEYEFEKEILTNLRKPVEICKRELLSFINKIDEIDNICVYGLSLGDVDLPYMKLINDRFPTCKWKFSYYSKADIEKIRKVAEILKIDKPQYEVFEFKNLDAVKIETRLVEENKIIKFPKLIR